MAPALNPPQRAGRREPVSRRPAQEDVTMARARKPRKNGRRPRTATQGQRLRDAARPAPDMSREQPAAGPGPSGVWGDLNQRVMQDFADLWLRGARESTRALTRMQEANLEAWREAQGAALRWLRRGVTGIADAGSTGTSRAA